MTKNKDPLAGLRAATEHLKIDTPEEEAKQIIKNAMPFWVDLSHLELEEAISLLQRRCTLPKPWWSALKKDVRELRRKPKPQPNDNDLSPAEELAELIPIAKKLTDSPDVLGEAVAVLRLLGVAGQVREIKLLYLALTTRIFSRPVNVAAKGPSSGGKSHLVGSVLALFPRQSYYALSAMSEKALAYSQEPLSHRFLVIYEATGLGSEFAQYLMRSLLSEGCVRYETVDKTRDGLVCRLIEREGPTGLIVTTTRTGLHPENETRLFSLEVDDSPEQTRNVLLAHASADSASPDPDLAPFHAFQRILEIMKPEVVVPFACAMADGCDTKAVRLRRDFPAVLTLVKAHAVLHVSLRKKDEHGRVLATPEDYMAVYDLVADLVSYGTGQRVPETIRETVAVVEQLTGGNSDGVTYSAIGKKLAIDESAARRRAKTAISKGYLENRETKPRCAAKIVTGEPLPDGKGVLPHPKSLFNNPPESTADLPTYKDSCENTKAYGRQTGEPTDYQLPTDATAGLGAKEPKSGSAVGTGLAERDAYFNPQEIQGIKQRLVGRQGNQEGYRKKFFQNIQPVSPHAVIRQWNAEHQRATAIKLRVQARENDAALSGLLDGKEVDL